MVEYKPRYYPEVPEHGPIEATSVNTENTEHLTWVGKAEYLPNVSAFSYEVAPLPYSIIVHGSGLVQLMTQMCGCLDAR
jgi:hypothetical protein